MDHSYSGAVELDAHDGVLMRAAKRIDRWALENPYQAAAAGAVIGLAGSVVFNRLLLIKGAAALAGCAYGAIKGGILGYTYPTARVAAKKFF